MVIIEREMGFSYAEFFRLLPKALPKHDLDGHHIVATADDGARLSIELGEESKRCIAMLAIPTIPVIFRFEHCSESRARMWLADFDRHYQRGGG